jgi:hypothetical protein
MPITLTQLLPIVIGIALLMYMTKEKPALMPSSSIPATHASNTESIYKTTSVGIGYPRPFTRENHGVVFI